MSKTTLAATLAAGIALGAGGTVALTAVPPAPLYEAHALDLRRVGALQDGGANITVQAWGDRLLPDGGRKDVSGGALCPLVSKSDEACKQQLMKSAAACIHE